MAISSISNGSSSIYGTRNVISGLASGMDTESLIENAVSGYKTKITNLQQQRTKVEWQQEAYRSIVSKMAAFSDKYASYMSANNLMSSSFFNSAVKVSSAGEYADKVSAAGRTNSSVQVLGVKQLARAATYSVTGGNRTDEPTITGGKLDLKEQMDLSKIAGSMTINYGGNRSYTINFDELEVYKTPEELAKAIDEKLGEQDMTLSNGDMVKANTRIGARVNEDSGAIELYDKVSNNNVYISGATGDLKNNLGIKPGKDATSIDLGTGDMLNKLYTDDTTRADYLATRELSFTVDGVTKKIKIGEIDTDKDGTATTEELQKVLQEKLDEAFGAGKVKVDTVAVGTDEEEKGFGLTFSTDKGSTMSIEGGTALGMKNATETTYINTGKTLGEAWGNINWKDLPAAKGEDDAELKDSNGKTLYELKINGVTVGNFNEDTEVGTVLNAINNNEDLGISVSYSRTTNQFQFAAKESGSAGKITMDSDLARNLFGVTGAEEGSTDGYQKGTYQKGQDAIFSLSVNGQTLDGITRSSNSFDVDGLTLNLKGTFGEYNEQAADGKYTLKDENVAKNNAVTFTSTSDADKIVDVIKSFVEDYNAMVTEIKNAYSTLPAQKSNGTYYQPLTEEDMEGMSESTIKAYEDKAKQGLLFGDRDLSTLYNRMLSAISKTGADGDTMRAIGLETAYSNGLTTLKLDENKLRSALETDPDKVRDFFTKSKETGASTDGLMQSLKTPLDMYAKTSGTKGILVEKAGHPLAASTLYQNTIQTQLNNIDTQIEKWQDKMSDQIDRYTSQFSKLEQLIAQMNSQSSALSQFMGSGY